MNKYKIVFKGRDYSSFSDCLDDTEISNDEGEKIEAKNFPLKLEDVLIEFLDSFGEKTLSSIYANMEDDSEGKNTEKKKLYTKLARGYMFNGQIGFLRKKDFVYSFSNEAAPDKSEKYDLDITLRCVSRFDDEKKGYFLCSMLLHSDLSFVDSLIPTDDCDDIFEYMLLFRYVSLLREAFIKGYYKKYVTFHNNDERLKGSIDIAQHIKLNIGCDNGRIAYTYRENTVKNSLNMLIIAAYQKLNSKFQDMMGIVFTSEYEDIINTLKAELGYSDCSVSDLIRLNSKPIYHPYYSEYESLREICLKILRDEGMNLFAFEEIDEVTGYLVYVPNLWENFLMDQFNRFDKLIVKPQFSQNVAESENHKFALNIRPDFVFCHNDNTPAMMLDAKFIPRWENAADRDDFSDVSGDFNKCVRDMTCLKIHKTGVVFPCKEKRLFKQYKVNSDDLFYTMGIKVPDSKQDGNFYEWNRLLETEISDLINEKLLSFFNT